jgi:hypothetical protein
VGFFPHVKSGAGQDIRAAIGHAGFTLENGHVQCTTHVRFEPDFVAKVGDGKSEAIASMS